MMAWVMIFLGPDPPICCCPISCCCCWPGSFGLVPGSSNDLPWVSCCPANLTWEVPCPSCDSLGSVCDLTCPARPGPFTAPPWLLGSGLDVCWCPKDVLRKAPFVLMVPQIVHTQWNMPKSRYCLWTLQNQLYHKTHWPDFLISEVPCFFPLFTHICRWNGYYLAMHQTFSSVITDIPSSQLILGIWYQVCCKASVSNNIFNLFFLFLFPTPQWTTSIRSQLT